MQILIPPCLVLAAVTGAARDTAIGCAGIPAQRWVVSNDS